MSLYTSILARSLVTIFSKAGALSPQLLSQNLMGWQKIKNKTVVLSVL